MVTLRVGIRGSSPGSFMHQVPPSGGDSYMIPLNSTVKSAVPWSLHAGHLSCTRLCRSLGSAFLHLHLHLFCKIHQIAPAPPLQSTEYFMWSSKIPSTALWGCKEGFPVPVIPGSGQPADRSSEQPVHCVSVQRLGPVSAQCQVAVTKPAV